MKKRKDKRFYILYSSDDISVATFEDQYELGEFLGKPHRSLQSTISRLLKGKTKRVLDKHGSVYNLFVYRKDDE